MERDEAITKMDANFFCRKIDFSSFFLSFFISLSSFFLSSSSPKLNSR